MGGAVPSMSLLGKRQLGAEKQAPRLTVAPHPSGAHAPPCQAEPCACRQPRKTGISGTIDLGFVNSQPCLPSGRSSAPAVRLRISPRAPAMLCEPTRLFPQPPCSPRNSRGGTAKQVCSPDQVLIISGTEALSSVPASRRGSPNGCGVN